MTLRTLRIILAAIWATFFAVILYFVPEAREAALVVVTGVLILFLVLFTVFAFVGPDGGI